MFGKKFFGWKKKIQRGTKNFFFLQNVAKRQFGELGETQKNFRPFPASSPLRVLQLPRPILRRFWIKNFCFEKTILLSHLLPFRALKFFWVRSVHNFSDVFFIYFLHRSIILSVLAVCAGDSGRCNAQCVWRRFFGCFDGGAGQWGSKLWFLT